MTNNFNSWTRNINIPFVNRNSYPVEVELSSITGRNLYLGDYKRHGGSYAVSGWSYGDEVYNLRFDNSPVLSFDKVGLEYPLDKPPQ